MSLARFLLFFLTAAAFLLAGWSVLVGPLPLWIPLAFVSLYFAVIGFGVLNLRLRMFSDAICSVPAARGQVALTFDDGPDPHSTPEVLTMLKQANARATFFLVGKKVAKYPEIVRAIVEAGHALGVHSYEHDRLYAFLSPRAVRADIERTRDSIETACGERPLWFRPPIGQMSPRTAAGVERAGALVVGWNVRARDGLRATSTEDCAERVLADLEQGAIVLLHDAWENQEVPAGTSSEVVAASPAGVRALGRILAECKRRELRPVTIPELLENAV